MDDFDPNQEPIDGEQYLRSVIYERSNCPAVVVKPIKRNKNKRKSVAAKVSQSGNESKTVRSVWDQYAEVG